MSSARALFYSPVFVVLAFSSVLVLALGVSRLGYSSDSPEGYSELPLVMTLGAQEAAIDTPMQRYVARVEAAQRVELGFDISSVIIEIYKREGERFQKGELLAQLDARRLQARLVELRAARDRATALLKLADVSLERVKGLRGSNSVSAQALDEASRQKEASQADLRLAEAQLATIELELEKSNLFAPFDGVVIDRTSDVGRTVSLGMPVLLVEQSAEPEVRASVPLDVAKSLKIDQTLRLTHEDRVLEGVVTRIKLSLSSSRSSDVYMSVMTADEALVPGEIVNIEIPASVRADGVWLPLTALTEYGRGLWSVYLAEPDPNEAIKNNRSQIRRTVVSISRVRGDYALVTGGVDVENRGRVVAQATHRIVEGQYVRTQPTSSVASK
jgi:RND family efflux transporter MFP subunit